MRPDGWVTAVAVTVAVAVATWQLRPRVPARRFDGGRELIGMAARLRRRRRRPATEPCAAYLDALARELRVGSGLAGAFADVTARHTDVHAVLGASMEALRAGQPLNKALALARTNGPDAAFMVQALRCVDVIGGPGAATLDAAAVVLRERSAVVADAAAHSAQARLSARVLTIVPLAFALWGLLASGQTRTAYLASPIGGSCIAAGLTLNGFGWWWMRRIVGATRPGPHPAKPERATS